MGYIEAICKRVLFHSDDNGFTICKAQVFKTDEDMAVIKSATEDNLVSFSGYFPRPNKEEKYIFEGEFSTHPKYGIQYNVSKLSKPAKDNNAAIIKFLSGPKFEGVGLKTATEIFDKLGRDCLKKIEKDYKVILDIVSEVKAKKIQRTISENKNSDDVLLYLYDFGFTPRISMRIFKVYKNDAINIIEENPYTLLKDIEGIGFQKVDELAIRKGIDRYSDERVRAIVLSNLKNLCMRNGFTYLTFDQLVKYSKNFVRDITLSEETVVRTINYLAKENELIVENDKVYNNLIYNTEIELASILKKFINVKSDLVFDQDDANHIEEKLNLKYTKKQIEAIKLATENNIFILTGGPGTGKTTVIKGIVESLIDSAVPKDKITLLAPTGRAAKRMNESTNMKANTIHKFLQYSGGDKFHINEHNKIDTDAIIIDESSMIDIFLMHNLFKSIYPTTKIIIVGDENQLPSVGPGQVLKDLLESNIIKSVQLDEIHRQAADSAIIKLAHNVNFGTVNYDLLFAKQDISFIKSNTKNFFTYLQKVIDVAIKKKNTFDNLQIIAPMYKSEVGIDNINNFIQDNYNKKSKQRREIKNFDKIYRVGDKVLQLENRAFDNIMNGDIGTITGISLKMENEKKEDLLIVDFNSNVVEYTKTELFQLTHAYAISVHKSQGSEYDIVILPIFKNYRIMLKRKLLYTAITRSKKALVIIGDDDALNIAAQTISKDRQSTLKSRLLIEKKIKLKKDIPFEDLGEENMENISPYNFMK